MIGENVIECPACAGPPEGRASCATCGGIMEVTQAMHDDFVIKRDKADSFNEFIFGVEQTIRTATYSSVIIVTVDDVALTHTPE
jgi:hypothetical protein